MSNNQTELAPEAVQDSLSQVAQSAPQPRMYSEDEVNRIAGAKKKEGMEKGRKEAEREYQQRTANVGGQVDSGVTASFANPNEQTNASVPRVTQSPDIAKHVQEELQKHALHAEMNRVANSYFTNMAAGKGKYQDFDEVTKDFDVNQFPNLAYTLHDNPHAADIVYELSKNPSKLAQMDYMTQKMPKHAKAELLKMGNSIAENQKAQQDAQSQGTNAPLDRLQPSRVTGSNGKLSIRDLRNQSWLRG